MRIYEFANAEEQLALLRTIIDNTWTAIAQQAEQQNRAEAERKAKSKLKPGSKKSSRGTSLRIPAPLPPQPAKPTPSASQQPTLAQSKATLAYPTLQSQQISPNPKLNPQATTGTPSTKIAYPQPEKSIADAPTKPSIASKMRFSDKNMGALEKDDDGNDRHSKNGIASRKK
jgi:hypothetical protein